MTQPEDSKWNEQEWARIHQRRTAAFGAKIKKETAEPKNLVGLALSGGGIRSALYNDGFLQGLSHCGFLRYVDYLASVSGGGYIAGNLIAQSDPKGTQESFHDNPELWPLGRNPQSGKFDETRLPGVGGYLNRPLEFLPVFVLAGICSIGFYLGFLGILATLAALFWRMFDQPAFRTFYFEIYGFQFGNELTIAFIPFFLMVLVYAAAECAFTAAILSWKRFDLRPYRKSFRGAMLVAIPMTAMISVAVFLGNGYTNVKAGEGSLYLNHYAQWLAGAAGVLQLLVFFGKDYLFKSEKASAKSWQQRIQRVVSVCVFLFLIFAMVHIMARENISGFTDQRSSVLERGDIEDWNAVSLLFDNFDKRERIYAKGENSEQKVTGPSLDLIDYIPASLKPQDSWRLRKPTWFVQEKFDKNGDASDKGEPRFQEDRIGGLVLASVMAGSPIYSEIPTLPPMLLRQHHLLANVVASNGLFGETYLLMTIYKSLQRERLQALEKWNAYIKDIHFTEFLVERMIDSKPPQGMDFDIGEWLKSNNVHHTTDDKRQSLASDARLTFLSDFFAKLRPSVHGSKKNPDKTEVVSNDIARIDPDDIAKANRYLLESVYPMAVLNMDIESTHNLAQYDQVERREWLGFWILVTLAGTIGMILHHGAGVVFQYYEKQLADNFLKSSHGTLRGDQALHEIAPTRDGLPYPIYLATSMTPAKLNGGYRIFQKPFEFTPLYCGDLHEQEDWVGSDRMSISVRHRQCITLAEAVTISGAAVTPLMTNNRLFSILLDFFNVGLGKKVFRKEEASCGPTSWRKYGTWLAYFGVMISIVIVGLVLLNNVFYALGAGALATLMAVCLKKQLSSPYLLKQLAVPQEIKNMDVKPAESSKAYYVADGGFYDYLGISSLLDRRCDLIVVSDAGANLGGQTLGTLTRMCEETTARTGIRFLDLDHEAPLDFGRLKANEERLVHQPFICIRARYPEPQSKEALIIYCQMAITDNDPLEIKQIRNRFPQFPDEPTMNQFYTDDQVSAYRTLGYHIAKRVGSELERWEFDGKVHFSSGKAGDTKPPLLSFKEALLCNASEDPLTSETLPYFDVMKERLLTSYRLACYEEINYRKDDIFCEAIWPRSTFASPQFSHHVQELLKVPQDQSLSNAWLRTYERSPDVRSAYRKAILQDVNDYDLENRSFCAEIWQVIKDIALQQKTSAPPLSAHLICMAVAAQEIHRGRPHSAFQIGGRSKLLDLCDNLASSMKDFDNKLESNPSLAKPLHALAGQAVCSLIEMERSVFQGSEHLATLSFAQCLFVMSGRSAHDRFRVEANKDELKENLNQLFKPSHSAIGLDSQLIECRKQLDESLKTSNTIEMITNIKKLWYLGYFGIEGLRGYVDEKSKNKPSDSLLMHVESSASGPPDGPLDDRTRKPK